MTQLFVLNYYAAYEINKDISLPELVGVFSDYKRAWSALEHHAKRFPDADLDLSAADMGAILLFDDKSEEWVMGGYGLEEVTLNEAKIE